MSIVNTKSQTFSGSAITVPVGIESTTIVGKVLYAINSITNQVLLFDASSNRALTVSQKNYISVGKKPLMGVASGAKLYVNNSLDNTVSVIDTVKNMEVVQIPVGKNPVSLQVVNGIVFVLNADDNSVSVIDTATDTVTQTLPTGGRPLSSLVTPEGVYIINYDGNSLTYIRTNIPHLLEFTTDKDSGTYGEDTQIAINALFDGGVLPDSTMQVLLNNNKKVTLSFVNDRKLSGVYTVKNSDDVNRLHPAHQEKYRRYKKDYHQNQKH
jgi:YVTN family beta-propeller protein